MKKIHYVVVYLIKGKAKNYQIALSRELSKKFRIKDVSARISPHITLKFIGEIDKIQLKELENSIKSFSKDEKTLEIDLNGINHFGKEVIFTDVNKSEDLVLFYHRLFDKLKELSWMPTNNFEGDNMHFHSTLAVDNISKKFDKMYSYLLNRNPRYKINLDNITILRMQNKNKWKIHKTFRLKNKTI